MSVNLPPRYRVIAIIVIVALGFSTLAWSGENRLQPASQAGSDTIPSRPKRDKKVVKRRQQAEEGRVARELDLRMDVEELEGLPELSPMDLPEADVLDQDMLQSLDIPLDLEAEKGLNTLIEADVFKDVNAWKSLGYMKEMEDVGEENLPMGEDALDELNAMGIGEEDLQTLKELNIDEDVWNELKGLKDEMDDLRNSIGEERSNGGDEYRMREEVKRVIEAVRLEIPRVRREVEKALQEYRDSECRKWQ